MTLHYLFEHVLLLAAVLAVTTPAIAYAAEPEFKLLESEPRTGSSIRRSMVWGSPVPINKKYDELSTEQKNSLKEVYESMAPGDEPPFPAEGLKPIHQALAKAQQKLLVTGELILFATVDADGSVSRVKAIGSPSPEMTKFASSLLLLTKFKPALCQGEPCKMDFPFRFGFDLR